MLDIIQKSFIRDLLARLDSETVIHIIPEDEDQVLYSARINGGKWLINDAYYIEEVKPYLRPLKSITEEEYEELKGLVKTSDSDLDLTEETARIEIDWLIDHHFDYRGLIEEELAIKITKDNNPYESRR